MRGKSHVDGGLPNQDRLCVEADASGSIVCAVVSDGAGTAPRAEEGATETSRTVAAHLFAAAQQHDGIMSAEQVRTAASAAIERVRGRLEAMGELKLFHCTLVASLTLPWASYVVQLGDSVALSTRFNTTRDEDAYQVDFFPPCLHVLYDAERGEYSNETHFITEDDWDRRLCVYEVAGSCDALVLMTDGAMDVALLRGEVFRGFLSNLLARLMATNERSERDQVIATWLDDPQTYRVTGDDKTLFVAVRTKRLKIGRSSLYTGQRGEPAPLVASQPESVPTPWPLPQPIRYEPMEKATPVRDWTVSLEHNMSAARRLKWIVVIGAALCFAGGLMTYFLLDEPPRAERQELHAKAETSRQEARDANQGTQKLAAELEMERKQNEEYKQHVAEQARKEQAQLQAKGDLMLRRGQGIASLYTTGVPLRITVIRPSEASIGLVPGDRRACSVGTVLNTGSICTIAIKVSSGGPGDNFRVQVVATSDNQSTVIDKDIVFAWPDTEERESPTLRRK